MSIRPGGERARAPCRTPAPMLRSAATHACSRDSAAAAHGTWTVNSRSPPRANCAANGLRALSPTNQGRLESEPMQSKHLWRGR